MKIINNFISPTISFDTNLIWSTLKHPENVFLACSYVFFYFKHVTDNFIFTKIRCNEKGFLRMFLSFHKCKVCQIMSSVSNYYLFSNGVSYKALIDILVEK